MDGSHTSAQGFLLCAYDCITLQCHLAYINHPEYLLQGKGYHHQHCSEQNDWVTGGKYKQVHWKRVCQLMGIISVS
jgi:hypothetical protein